LLCADRLACWLRWEAKHLMPLLRQAAVVMQARPPEAEA